ncbi:MAG: LCP family protein [Clostridia bacterium]|nr:LCP family protein [Clostridia bacterium]MBQ8893189.1 LCP family protein [Clostridia bacterium]
MLKKFKFNALTRFIASFLITILVLGGVLWGVYAYLFSGMEQEEGLTREETGIEEQDYHHAHITNIALFGIDTTDSSMVGRSDSIVIVTIDEEMKEIRLSAVQRDTYVEIEGHGKTKLNHAYSYGGPALAVKTLNQTFGLNIEDYAVINFTNMEKVIDVLGGIQLDVSSAYRKEANIHIGQLAWERGITADLIPTTGLQTLSGMQVLGMVRARNNVGGTEARSEMHEIVLTACYEKLKKKNVLEYPAVAKELLELVKTTLSSGDVTNLGMKVVLGGYQIRQAVFPLAVDQEGGYGGKMIKGVWYLTYNEEPGNQHLRDFVYDGKLYGEETE